MHVTWKLWPKNSTIAKPHYEKNTTKVKSQFDLNENFKNRKKLNESFQKMERLNELSVKNWHFLINLIIGEGTLTKSI